MVFLGSSCGLPRVLLVQNAPPYASLFLSCFYTSFLKGPWCTFFFILSLFGSILNSFWCHFNDFLGMGGICENDGFTIVKLGFLRVRGIPDRSIFLMFFRCCFRVLLFPCFYAFYTFFGAHGLPNGLPWGTILASFWLKLRSLGGATLLQRFCNASATLLQRFCNASATLLLPKWSSWRLPRVFLRSS